MPIISGRDVIERLDLSRNAIRDQVRERDADFRASGPAWPWTLVTQQHSYVFDLPAEHLRRVRLHADVINGTLGAESYLMDPLRDGNAYARDSGYEFLGEGIPLDRWAREYPVPGMEKIQYGYNYKDLVLNVITVPRQQNACNFHRLIDDREARHVFVEIGGGYGSFALDMRQILPNCAYVIVDLPETLIFSASYLLSHCPDLRVYVYAPGDNPAEILKDTDSFDFAFIPNYRASALSALPHIDFGYNSISFPEMSLDSVKQYLDLISPKLRRFFMSVNLRYPLDRTIKRPGTDETLGDYFKLFPTPAEYRSQLSLTEDQYNNPSFRPVFLCTTDKCRPLKQTELHMFYNPNYGKVTVNRKASGAAIVRRTG